ncbi:MAG: diguanylate cyclase [Lachnospiraceae bacterium]|nr:diguanylate cyclase [Lachnospiraceae bacterium]
MKKTGSDSKKKIAVFANGWNSENLASCMEGVRDGLAGHNTDLYVFLGHDGYGSEQDVIKAEISVYELPRLSDFDGVILIASGMNFPAINEDIIKRTLDAGLPLVTIGGREERGISIYTDNYSGMKTLADHMIEVHGVRDILFIAGPKDNDDSNERLRAVIDSCDEHGVPFGEDKILYFNWDVFTATEYIKKKYQSGEKLPDVIMCANDNTAFYISFVSEDMGVDIPGDIRLTGFDGTVKAKDFYPAITSVTQPFDRMGHKAAECFIDIFAGRNTEDSYYFPCEFLQGESCGCDTTAEYDIRRREVCRLVPKNTVLADFRAGRIHFMENAVLKSDRYSTLGACLREYFYARDGQEGNPFYIFIDPMIEKLGEMETKDLPKFTLPDTYDMLVGKNGSVKYDEERRNPADGLIPDPEPGRDHIYVFMPLYIDTFICGYMVMADNLSYFEKTIYSNFKSSLNRILGTYTMNLKLSALNDRLSELLNRDPMTLVKNRVAYENYRNELNEKMTRGELEETAFVMFDVNDLKKMNDTYGHEKGDEYIRNSCALICSCYVHSPVFRIGGDEFMVVLSGQDYKDRDRLLKEFRDRLRALSDSDVSPEKKVSVASGMAVCDFAMDKSVDEAIKRADKEMYLNKRKMKES